MTKGNILFVDRCNHDKTVLEVFTNVRGAQASFIRDKKQVTRFFGPAVPLKVFKQVQAIFSESQPILPPKLNLDQAQKEKLKPISRKWLTKHEGARFSTLDKAGIKYLMSGWIRTTRWEKIDDQLILIPMKVIDLPAAIRQQQHILDGYQKKAGKKQGELPRVMDFTQGIEKIHGWLINWNSYGKAKKFWIKHEMARIILSFEYCTNEYKAEVRDRMIDMSSLEDVLGRLNPGAIAAGIVPILGLLAGRLEEMRIIIPASALRLELLKFEKAVMQMEVNNALAKLRNLLRKSNDQILDTKKNTETRIRQIMYNLYRLHPSPYFEARHFSINQLAIARDRLIPRTIYGARQKLKIVRQVLSNEL